MKCPDCGRATRVYDSRERGASNTVWRRRSCSCGKRFSSCEIICGSPEEAEEMRSAMNHIDVIKESMSSLAGVLNMFCRPNSTKKCSKCEESKAFSQFYKDSKSGDGFRPECIACGSKQTDTGGLN